MLTGALRNTGLGLLFDVNDVKDQIASGLYLMPQAGDESGMPSTERLT